MSGMPDFPGLPIMVTARDRAFFDRSQDLGHAGPPGFGPPFTQTPFNWQAFDFEGGPYLGFARSHDVHGDGSVVCVPAPGHTPGSIIVFVTLPRNVRYALVGDLVWQREGLTRRLERPWLMKLLGDTDPEGTRQNLLKMISVMQLHTGGGVHAPIVQFCELVAGRGRTGHGAMPWGLGIWVPVPVSGVW
jgi:N-acyl homoserine lactone hydrolase